MFPEFSKTEQSMAYNWERAGGLDALEEVQTHQNIEIYKASAEIILKYFK